MKRILALTIVSLLWAGEAFAVDNTLLITPCASGCITTKSKDIGAGVQAPQPIISDTSGNPLSTPTAGADAVSNTLTGLLIYNRNLVFNGTTWDRWQGAVTATLAAETTKVIGTIRIASGGVASGSFASGSVASGAFASGALASGSVASGAVVDLGAQADTVAAADTSTASLIALLKRTNTNLTTLNTSVNAAIPTGTNTIGNTGFDPSSGKATPAFAFLALPATTTTQIVALSGSTKTYVTSLMAFAGGTVNITFKYGTGSNCGTGTTTLAGPYPLTAQAGFTQGAGTGAVMIVPAGQALCITTDASVTGGVQLTHQQI